MEPQPDLQTSVTNEAGPVERIRISSSSTGCVPECNPARPKKEGGRVRFVNRTKAPVVITLDKEIFTERGNPYTISTNGNGELFHIDETLVQTGEEVEYGISGSKCGESVQSSNDVQYMRALSVPRMIID